MVVVVMVAVGVIMDLAIRLFMDTIFDGDDGDDDDEDEGDEGDSDRDREVEDEVGV